MNAPTKPSSAFGLMSEIGFYLGARSPRTGRRWVAELIADGLKGHKFGGRTHYRFADVDRIIARRKRDS